jgi:hypothetical protein
VYGGGCGGTHGEDVACAVHGDDGGLSGGDCSDVRFLEL